MSMVGRAPYVDQLDGPGVPMLRHASTARQRELHRQWTPDGRVGSCVMSLSVDRLDRSHLEPVSELCRRAIVDPPSFDELDGALFASDQSVALLGDPAAGVVAIAECADGAHIRLLAVDPSARGLGHGGALLQAAEEWAAGAGHRSLVTGADPPYHLWPGVPTTETALLCLLESRHYIPDRYDFDMRMDLGPLPPDPGGHALARSAERAEIEEWTATHWPGWLQEVSRAADKGNLVLAREAGDGGDVSAHSARSR